VSNMVGALIGAAIDRRDGDSGVKGAFIGAAAQGALRIAVPLAIIGGIGWFALRGIRDALRGAMSEEAAASSRKTSPA
jgi:hypothetical protein